jgi:hypothetical protein
LPVRLSYRQLTKQMLPSDDLTTDFLCELNTVAALYHGDLDQALACAQRLGCSDAEPWRRLGAKLEIYCLLATSRTDDAVRRAACYCSQYEDFG